MRTIKEQCGSCGSMVESESRKVFSILEKIISEDEIVKSRLATSLSLALNEILQVTMQRLKDIKERDIFEAVLKEMELICDQIAQMDCKDENSIDSISKKIKLITEIAQDSKENISGGYETFRSYEGLMQILIDINEKWNELNRCEFLMESYRQFKRYVEGTFIKRQELSEEAKVGILFEFLYRKKIVFVEKAPDGDVSFFHSKISNR